MQFSVKDFIIGNCHRTDPPDLKNISQIDENSILMYAEFSRFQQCPLLWKFHN